MRRMTAFSIIMFPSVLCHSGGAIAASCNLPLPCSQNVPISKGLPAMSITNSGRRSHMRVTGEFVLRVSDAPKLPKLLASLSSELAQLPQVDAAATPVAVNVAGFTPAGVTLSVSALFGRGSLTRDALRSAVWLLVSRVVEREGCAFAGKG